MTTADRSAHLAQDIAADVRALRLAVARLSDQQAQLAAHAAQVGASPNARAALARLAEAVHAACYACGRAGVKTVGFPASP